MFDILPKALASVASLLFPLFASYKALNTSDPAQLTPWLMYWVVLSCVVFFESWTDWILVWVPFYYYLRLIFLLYLVLPQTQGARLLYQTHIHPWLAEHEAQIDGFISSAHARMLSASMHYLKQAIAYLRDALGLPVAPGTEAQSAASESPRPSDTGAYSYTQSLLARFALPSARWPGGAMGSAAAASASTTSDASIPSNSADFYNLLANAVGALGTATGAAGGVAAGAAASALSRGIAGFGTTNLNNTSQSSTLATPGTLVPPHIKDTDRASFLATQRDLLRTLLSALEREAAQLEDEEDSLSNTSPLSRPLSSASGLSKSRSEVDFEKIDAESGAEEETPLRLRHRAVAADGDTVHPGPGKRTTSGSWLPWGWGASGTAATPGPDGSTREEGVTSKSTSYEQ
ncbi:MAG: hypothetical protein SEPTF4163_006278 [Sporothrix epigloea]